MTESQLTTTQQMTSIWELGGLKVRELVRLVWQQVNDDNLVNRASELAYNFLLALFPFLLFLLVLFGLLAARGPQLQQELFSYIGRVLPATAAQLVSKTLSEIVNASGGGKLTFGIILALWSASSGTSTMMSLLTEAYHVRDSRPWWKTKLIALGLTIAMSALTMAALVIVLFGGPIANFVGRHIGLGGITVFIWKVAQWPAALFFVAFAFSLIYYFGPDVKEQHWYWITPGSVVGVFLWLACSFGFRAYLHFSNSYTKTYGSLGAVIILLLWFYMTGLAFLIGGHINAQIEHAAAERGHPEAKLPGRKVA